MEIVFPSADSELSRLEVASAVLNRFYWNVSVDRDGDEFCLRGGDQTIGRFSDIEELTTFAAGMALALSLLPDEAVETIDHWVGE